MIAQDSPLAVPPPSILRVTGPWGYPLLQKARPDLARCFDPTGEHHDLFFKWIYHTNVQTPSGETAFHLMHIPFGWAKRPMVERVADISPLYVFFFPFSIEQRK